MKDNTIRNLVLSALFAALCCAATMVIQIPIATGYLNLGEGMCLLAGLMLGPWFGAAAAGIGSGLADLLSGYGFYAPATLLIKALVALTAGYLLQPVCRKESAAFWKLIVIELPAELLMVLGYFGFETLVLGEGAAAAAAIPNNLLQAALGIAVSVLLYQALRRIPAVQRVTEQK